MSTKAKVHWVCPARFPPPEFIRRLILYTDPSQWWQLSFLLQFMSQLFFFSYSWILSHSPNKVKNYALIKSQFNSSLNPLYLTHLYLLAISTLFSLTLLYWPQRRILSFLSFCLLKDTPFSSSFLGNFTFPCRLSFCFQTLSEVANLPTSSKASALFLILSAIFRLLFRHIESITLLWSDSRFLGG